jgi:amino acid transporter
MLLIGVKESTFMNKIFTILNIAVISLITICGAVRINFSNWHIRVEVN